MDKVTLYDVKCNHYASDIQAVKAVFCDASNYIRFLEIGICFKLRANNKPVLFKQWYYLFKGIMHVNQR